MLSMLFKYDQVIGNGKMTKPYLFHRIQNYDATCRLAQEIAENIHERGRLQRTGGNPAKVCISLPWQLHGFAFHVLLKLCDGANMPNDCFLTTNLFPLFDPD